MNPKEIVVKNKIEMGKSIKISHFKKDTRITEPHKHQSYFEIIYLSKGKGFHTIDSQRYLVTPPVIFIVRKEQVHHWELSSQPDGYVLILKKAFVDGSLDKDLKALLATVSSFSSIYPKENKVIEILFELLVTEYRVEENNNTPVMEGLLKVLLAKILELAKTTPPAKKDESDLYQNFREMLSQDKTIKNSVAYYASILNTSPQNLNAYCRKSGNQSATEVLAEFIISEAKRLLHYTDMTVSEISLSLDFKDNSHFVKYFKRHTGHTPQAFRALS